MILCTNKPKSFKEFKELATMHKFGTIGFVFLYGYQKYGWKYRIIMRGTRRDLAYKEAHRLLFTEVDEYDADFVEVAQSDERLLKMPISCNFAFAVRVN